MSTIVLVESCSCSEDPGVEELETFRAGIDVKQSWSRCRTKLKSMSIKVEVGVEQSSRRYIEQSCSQFKVDVVLRGESFFVLKHLRVECGSILRNRINHINIYRQRGAANYKKNPCCRWRCKSRILDSPPNRGAVNGHWIVLIGRIVSIPLDFDFWLMILDCHWLARLQS